MLEESNCPDMKSLSQKVGPVNGLKTFIYLFTYFARERKEWRGKVYI